MTIREEIRAVKARGKTEMIWTRSHFKRLLSFLEENGWILQKPPFYFMGIKHYVKENN